MKNNFKNRQLIARVLDLAKVHQHEGENAPRAEADYYWACNIMAPAWNNDRADISNADMRALRSLGWSVGVAHPDYILAKEILAQAEAAA